MYDTPESFEGPKLTSHDDPRVTHFGAWLRATKINELPQLWNVLKGDMSLVGPRPEDPVFVAAWTEDVRKILLSVKPGITSPASVVYRDLEKLLHPDRVVDEYLQTILPTKMRIDTLYVRNRTILTDLDVVFWTLVSLLPRMRNQKVLESQLFWGPLSSFIENHFRWFVIDFFISLLSIALIGGVWRTIQPLRLGWFWAPLIALAMALVFGTTNSLLGLNRIFWSKARPSDAIELAVSSGISILILFLVDGLLIRQPNIPPGLYLFGGLVSFLGFLTVRYRERLITGFATLWLQLRLSLQTLGERVLIIGAGELGEFAAWLVRNGDLARAFHIIGMVDDDPRKLGMRINGIRVVGTTKDIQKIVAKNDIGVILFAIYNINIHERDHIIRICEGTPSKLVLIPNVVNMMRAYFSQELLILPPNPSTDDGITTQLLDAYLAEVEQHLARGDTTAAIEQIRRLRMGYFGEGNVEAEQDTALAK